MASPLATARWIGGLLALIPSGLPAQNLIRNPGFEDVGTASPIAAWSVNPSWYIDPKEKGLAAVSADPEVFQGLGRRSLKMDGQGKRGLAQQSLAGRFAPGQRLRLSGWMKFESIRPAVGRISVSFHGQNGKWLGQRDITTDWRIKTLDWQRDSAEFVLPDGVQSLQVSVSTDTGTTGVVWFDNLCLERLPDLAPPVEPALVKPANVEGVIPLDDCEADCLRLWSGDSWGRHDAPRLSLSTESPHQGEQALRMEFFGDGSHATRPWPFDEPWDALVLRVRRIEGNAALQLCLSRQGVAFRAAAFRPAEDWTKLVIWRDEIRYAWGAKTESQKAFSPVGVNRLEWSADGPMVVEVDAIRLWAADRVGMLYAAHETLGNVVAPDTPSRLGIGLFNTFAQPRTVRLELVLRDLDGQPLDRQTRPVELAPRSFHVADHPLPPLPPGYFSVDCTLHDGDRTVKCCHVGVCSLPRPEPEEKGTGFFGANPMGGISSWNVPLLARIGVRKAGVYFCWAWQQRHKDQRQIDVAKTLERYEAHGVTPIGFLAVDAARVPPWAAGPRVEKASEHRWSADPQDWENYVRAVATACDRRIKHWSLCCEVDLAHRGWAGGLDGYVDAVRRACRVLKEVDPQCVVGGVSVSGVDCTCKPRFPIARRLWAQLGDTLDGFNLDAYASPRTFAPGLEPVGDEANDLDGMLREAIALAKSAGPAKRVAIDEKGWAVREEQPVNSTYAREFGDVIARSLVIARAIPEIDYYLYFMMFGRSIEGGNNYGLWQIEGRQVNPTPGVAAYATAARLLDSASQGRRVPQHGDLWIYVFRRDAGSVAAIWTPLRQKLALTALLPADARALNVAGSPQPIPRVSAQAQLTISSSPIYLLSPATSAEEMTRLFESATVNLPCAKIAVTIPSTRRLDVHMRSQSNVDMEGEVTVAVPRNWSLVPTHRRAVLAAGQTQTLPFDLHATGSLEGTPGPIEVVFQSDRHGRATVREEPRFVAVHRLKNPSVVDGDVQEFAALPPLRLATAEMLGPSTDPAANGLWTGSEDVSVEAWTAWDDTHFHLAARVRDDQHVQSLSGADIWRQDCLQIAFDPLNNALPPRFSGRTGFDADDHELGLALTPNGPVLHRWAGAAPAPSEARLVIHRQSETTTYEWAVPWKELGLAQPVAGTILGMGFLVPDADEDRDASYWMQLSEGIANGKNPALYPKFVLMP